VINDLDVIFSHGQESGPWGSKITAMAAMVRDLGARADSVDYQGMADPGERVDKLVGVLGRTDHPVILVGSSMGGHVATAASGRHEVDGVFVLAPAYYMPGYESLTPPPPDCPLEIVHGWGDDVVPVENSLRFAREAKATLHVLDGDHRLTANIDTINALLRLFIERVAGRRGA
jgi:alpha-beta hydrolase superfamily lysophospholipase